MLKEIKYSPKTDIGISNLKDIVPERMIKVYPYEIPNASKSKAFMAGQTVSIAYISQNNLGIDAEGEDEEHILIDENGDKYFEIFAAITSDGVLDIASATSVYGQELKEEDSILALSNWYYEGELEDLQLGSARFMPAMFTIGKAFDIDEYEDGEQAVFMSTGMVEAKEGQAQYSLSEIDTEGLYEFQLVNTTAIESSFTNSRIIFTKQNVKYDVLTPEKETGIRIGIENHTLIHSIKGKGSIGETIDGTEQASEFGDIELISKEKLMPFKFTPISTQDKLTMYADWFDYDSVMPFVFAEKFKNAAPLSTIITNVDDRKMIEDMLVISNGFSNAWAAAPRDTTGENAGKIKADFRIGWTGLKVQALEGKDPIKVVDGIYEGHIRKFPAFTEVPDRYQPAREVLNALSRYIYSSYCIGKGQNAYHEAYLPWFLIPDTTSKIDTAEDKNIPNPDYGGSGVVTSFRLKDGTKFKIQSNFYKWNFSNDSILTKDGTLILPNDLNLSNIKLLQTDRKLTLPELPYTISGINKLPLPGDIVTSSSQDLSYMFYLPIQDQTVFENFMLDSSVVNTPTPSGTKVDVLIPDSSGRGAEGTVWTQAQANAQVKLQQPGNMVTAPIISQIDTKMVFEAKRLTHLGSSSRKTPDTVLVNGVQILPTAGSSNGRNQHFSNAQVLASIVKNLGLRDSSSVKITSNTLQIEGDPRNGGWYYVGTLAGTISHSEFTDAVVMVTGSTSKRTYGIQAREILFDKQQWKSFIKDFKIIPDNFITYDLLERRNFKIAALDELTIASAWGNYVELQFGNTGRYIRVPLFNEDDETIGVQRIIFT